MNNQLPQLLRIIRSTYEPSTNFLFNYGKGVIEARYVRKAEKQLIHKRQGTNFYLAPSADKMAEFLPEAKNAEFVETKDGYMAIYVSSHNGCRMGCSFCFLTQNQDTNMQHVNIDAYLLQLKTILSHYQEVVDSALEKPVKRCNINFMSKGEALANKYVVYQYSTLYQQMKVLCEEYGLEMKPNISTIMPTVIRDRSLSDIFEDTPVNLYYSLYSINPTFRAKWLPNALPYDIALNKLKMFQESRSSSGVMNNPITFHWALIKNHNDHVNEAKDIAKILKSYNFDAKLNIVRFNPHPNLSETEADPERIEEIFNIISGVFNNPKSYIVPRLDVKTSAHAGCLNPHSLLGKTSLR
jgi:23S rRNA (adenine2503-C2)-methyltransferase